MTGWTVGHLGTTSGSIDVHGFVYLFVYLLVDVDVNIAGKRLGRYR